MTFDPIIAMEILRGLLYTTLAVGAGVVAGMLISLATGGDR